MDIVQLGTPVDMTLEDGISSSGVLRKMLRDLLRLLLLTDSQNRERESEPGESPFI
jgi:hypothetical protein